MRWSVRTCSSMIMLWVLCFGLGAGAVSDGFAAARGVAFWSETPTTQIPTVQVPNFAELAEHLKPSVVNVSTTQVTKGQRRSMPRLPFPNPFGERDPSRSFLNVFSGVKTRNVNSGDAVWGLGLS
jgi:S1-C subfamily serine protease